MAFGERTSQYPLPSPLPGGGGAVSFPYVMPGAGFNALLGRFYDEFGNEMGRREKAFGWYEHEKARESDQWRRDQQRIIEDRKAAERARIAAEGDRRFGAEQQRRDIQQATGKAEAAERAAKQATVDRARAQHYSAPNQMVPFSPQGAVADYYEYLRGGAGGGSAPPDRAEDSDIMWQRYRKMMQGGNWGVGF